MNQQELDREHYHVVYSIDGQLQSYTVLSHRDLDNTWQLTQFDHNFRSNHFRGNPNAYLISWRLLTDYDCPDAHVDLFADVKAPVKSE